MSVRLSVCPPSVPLSCAPEPWAGVVWARVQKLLARPAPAQWVLPLAGAISLHPRQCSTLTVAAGQAWVTLRGAPALERSTVAAHDSASHDSGDYFLMAGDRLAVAAGQHVVLEAAGSVPVRGILEIAVA
jgi:hypothetical protein